MKTYTYVFDGSGTDTWVLSAGNFLQILSSTAAVNVEFFKRGSSIDERAEAVLSGFRAKPPRPQDERETAFDTVRIESPTAQTVTVAISRGEGDYGRITGDVVATPAAAGAWEPSADVSVAVTAVTQLVAARSNRRVVTITSLVTNPDQVRIGGDNTVSASGTLKGDPLVPGDSRIVEYTGAVWVSCPTAGPNVFAITEEY